MTQVTAEKTKRVVEQKLTLHKETLRDLQAPHSRIQQVNGGRESSQNTNTGDLCTFKVCGCA